MKKSITDGERQEEQDHAVALEMASIQEMPIQWLWPGRIVMENLTLLVGEPGTGKSALAIDLAARVTRGAAWPDGTPGGEAKSVLMVSAGDHAFFTVRPGLAAAGADMNKIATAYDAGGAKDHDGIRRPLSLPRDFNKLRKLIMDRGDCKLVVFDPITAFVRGGASLWNTLMTLVMMAGDLHVAILALVHLKPGGLRAMYRTEGGSALTSSARGVWLAVEDKSECGMRSAECGIQNAEGGVEEEDKGAPVSGSRRLLLPVKNNLVEESGGLAYRLRLAQGREVAKVEWEEKGVRQTADEALAADKKPRGRKPSSLGQAKKFLQEMLAYGPWQVKEVELAAEALHGIKRRTLVRARKALGIKHYRAKASGEVWMRLPSVKEIEEKTCKNSGTVGTQAENPGNQDTLSQEACVPLGTVASKFGTQAGDVGTEGIGGQKEEVGGQETGIRSQGSGIRGQGSGIRSQKGEESGESGSGDSEESAVGEKVEPLGSLGKNAGNNGVFPEAQAEPLEPLGKNAGNCDEIQKDERELAAPLEGNGANANVAGVQKEEVGGQKSEVGGQKEEVGGQKSEVGGLGSAGSAPSTGSTSSPRASSGRAGSLQASAGHPSTRSGQGERWRVSGPLQAFGALHPKELEAAKRKMEDEKARRAKRDRRGNDD